MRIRNRTAHDRGQATPLMALVVVIALACAAVIAHLGATADDAARARTAADAAALAGADAGSSAAAAMAAANGGELESYSRTGSVVEVVVSVDGVSARARSQVIIDWVP